MVFQVGEPTRGLVIFCVPHRLINLFANPTGLRGFIMERFISVFDCDNCEVAFHYSEGEAREHANWVVKHGGSVNVIEFATEAEMLSFYRDFV